MERVEVTTSGIIIDSKWESMGPRIYHAKPLPINNQIDFCADVSKPIGSALDDEEAKEIWKTHNRQIHSLEMNLRKYNSVVLEFVSLCQDLGFKVGDKNSPGPVEFLDSFIRNLRAQLEAANDPKDPT